MGDFRIEVCGTIYRGPTYALSHRWLTGIYSTAFDLELIRDGELIRMSKQVPAADFNSLTIYINIRYGVVWLSSKVGSIES